MASDFTGSRAMAPPAEVNDAHGTASVPPEAGDRVGAFRQAPQPSGGPDVPG